jgi:hypothetical protein
MSLSRVLKMCFVASFTPSAYTADFLTAGQVNVTQLEARLLSELADAVRLSTDNPRITKLQADLQQLFSVVPSSEEGSLDHHVVRYVLHRYFVAKHGWFIRGLEPDGDHRDDATEDSHAMTELQEWVPSYLQKFLEQLNLGKGMSLREVAVMAATLQDLIHKEAIERLELAWKALGFTLDMDLYTSQVKKVMETYMIIYDSGGNFTAESAKDVEEQLEYYTTSVKDWNMTTSWLRKVRFDMFPYSAGRNTVNFSQASLLVQEIGMRYGAFNDVDCGKLKKELLEVESPRRPGRIRLSEFYKKGLYSTWEFSEKRPYLKSLGALDESDPKQPYVILPNYVASRPNCLVCSNFYVVCCRNECEDLMAKIEAEVKTHSVKPDVLLRLIPRLSSSTIKAPRKMSNNLLDKLYHVAIVNAGQVPIHGRLFAQWMHHAFPRECPYPHEAGAASPQTPDEWMSTAGHSSHRATVREMKEHVDRDDCKDGSKCAEDDELPWTDGEELLTERQAVKRRPLRAILQKLAAFAVLGTMLTWATLSWRSIWHSEKGGVGSRKVHYA